MPQRGALNHSTSRTGILEDSTRFASCGKTFAMVLATAGSVNSLESFHIESRTALHNVCNLAHSLFHEVSDFAWTTELRLSQTCAARATTCSETILSGSIN